MTGNCRCCGLNYCISCDTYCPQCGTENRVEETGNCGLLYCQTNGVIEERTYDKQEQA